MRRLSSTPAPDASRARPFATRLAGRGKPLALGRWVISLAALGFVWLGTGIIPCHAHDMNELAQQRMLEGGLLQAAWLGAEHMLTGYDHLLFLFAVMLRLSTWRQTFAFVTVFTVGHTVTLLAATLAGVALDPVLIDAFIAVTVVYAALMNFEAARRLAGRALPPLLPTVFVIGLIHGCGLSTRLQSILLAADPDLVPKILAFNVGVELGQLAAIAVIALAVREWRRSRLSSGFAHAGSAAAALAGVVLFIEQLRAYS